MSESEEGVSMAKFEALVADFRRIRPIYQVFAEILKAALREATHQLAEETIVQTRAKSIASFAQKAANKLETQPDPINQFTDLCGARVITESKDSIAPICEFIRRHFEVDEEKSEDMLERLGTAEFGYRDIHFIVSLKEGELKELLRRMAGERTGPDLASFRSARRRLYERRGKPEDGEGGLLPGPRFKAEIQVRTILQHAWATFVHDRLYKGDFDVPRRLKRAASRIAASLEQSDASIASTIRGIESYRTAAGAYMKPKERQNAIKNLEAAARYAPEDMRLALKLAGFQAICGQWKKVEKVLAPFVNSWAKTRAAKQLKKAEAATGGDPFQREEGEMELSRLRDPLLAQVLARFGRARWERSKKDKDREWLRWAIALDGQRYEALVSLAETYLPSTPGDALPYYERAFRLAPSEPLVLGGFVRCRLLHERGLDFLPPLRPTLASSIRHCRRRASVKINLPRTFYDVGFFALLLGRPVESLSAYAKAVESTDNDTIIEDYLGLIRLLRNALRGSTLPHLDSVYRFLMAARVAKLCRWVEDAVKIEQAARKAREELEASENNTEKDEKTLETLQDAEKEVKRLRKKLKSARHELAPLASEGLPDFQPPVVLTAGGTDSRFDRQLLEYGSLLSAAFENFVGTVFGGGTRSGISGLVGDLPESERLVKIAILPAAIPPWTERHKAYKCYFTKGTLFSVLEPIQVWVDLLSRAISPSDIRLLGINGGPIAGFEFRMALAFGAVTGVMGDSGRAASEIFEDEEWQEVPGLLRLPLDAETLRCFLRDFPASEVLDPGHRETLARQAHEEYRTKLRRPLVAKDPSLSKWEDLAPDLKYSNLNQVDSIEEKLRRRGLRIRRASKPSLWPLSADDVEAMAEMEHGRWNAERLRSGWVLGARDVEKKKSPYLVSWADLPEEIKDYDRKAMRALPKMLMDLGYEIVRDE